MRIFVLTIVNIFLLLSNCLCQNHPVEMKNGFFYLNGKKTFIKGLGLEIVRPGQKLDSKESHDPNWFRYDAKRVLGAGYNTIRLWGAQTEEQLEAVKDLDIKIMMGIWIPNHNDYSSTNFIDSSLQVVKNVLAYSKNYDNIIAYIIMNEPNTDDITKNYGTTQLLWKTLVDEIHKQHPNTPVGISAWPNISYLNMDVFDFAGYNIHPETNTAQEWCYDYASYVNFLKTENGINKPFIVTEYGVNVAPNSDISRYAGSTQEERQANGLLYMYRSLIDGGASGSCPYISADGWYKDGNEMSHATNEEACGLIEYKSVTDMIGTPRPAWYALKEYNSAVITSPKNSEVYQNKLPVEIFGSDTITHFLLSTASDTLLFANISDNYFSDTISLNYTGGMHDLELFFTFYDNNNNIVKQETITCLTSDSAITLPQLAVTSLQKYMQGTANTTIKYSLINNPALKTSDKIKYSSDPAFLKDYDYSNKTFSETIPTTNTNYSFTKSYGVYGADVTAWTNYAICVFSAGIDISYGKFKKHISGQTILWQDTSFKSMPARIESEEFQFSSNMYPYYSTTEESWYIGGSSSNYWLEYYVNINETGYYKLRLRYSANENTYLNFIDGKERSQLFLSATGDKNWTNKDTTVELSKGNHRFIFESNTNQLFMNWFELSNKNAITDIENIKEPLAYPNPVTKGYLNVKLPVDNYSSNYVIELINGSGQICYSNTIKNKDMLQLNINTSKYSPGIYLLRLTNNKTINYQKIIIIK